ncbi:MAG TPA: TIGR03435 family protein [Bryobacteraceae bacterium]
MISGLLLASAAVLAQAIDSTLTFEVATVKPWAAGPDGRWLSSISGGPGSQDPGQIHYTGMPLRSLLTTAYNVKDYQVTAPEWMATERFDILAKIPAGTTKEQFNVMLQNLLKERFRMTLHRESKEMQGYELLVAKGGLKMKEVAVDPNAPVVDGPAFAPGERPVMNKDGFAILSKPALVSMVSLKGGTALDAHFTAKEQPLSKIVDLVGNEMKGPVVDKTGLTGKYDFTLEFAPDIRNFPGLAPPPPPEPGAAALPDPPTTGLPFQAAIQEQLGLHLEQKKVSVEMLVVDRSEKTPTEN